MNNLIWLQDFYTSLCNGDWEHSYGFKLDTMDNPGWHWEFNLRDTYSEWEFSEFKKIKIERSA